jgi:predicted RNA-binding protein with PUA-like domain
MPFLLKTEPGKYSFDDLERDGETTWDGISNNTALLNLRSMKPGENSSSTTPTSEKLS